MVQPGLSPLAGRYELTELLATGGMGRVWRARDLLLGRTVAVKVLRSEFSGNEIFLARFRAEARHAAVLRHEGIAAVYDYGEVPAADGGGQLAYLVMELVDGEPLSALLDREGRLDPQRTLALLRQTAAALAAAHDAGVVHRSVKPGSLLVSADGSPSPISASPGGRPACRSPRSVRWSAPRTTSRRNRPRAARPGRPATSTRWA